LNIAQARFTKEVVKAGMAVSYAASIWREKQNLTERTSHSVRFPSK